MRRVIAAATVCAALLAGCGGRGSNKTAPTVTTTSTTTSTSTSTTSTTVAETTTTAQVQTTTTRLPQRYPSGAVVAAGYPLLVSVGSIDERVRSWFDGQLNAAGQVVAVAPGVYVPFSDAAPDLTSYLAGPNDGDCAVQRQYFPEVGGACWNGVQPGSEEP